ncbi:DUF3037 domain-containing protein [Marinobacterium sp. AK62]|uniref:DUF3037 domain-containing protein n=1 Tax=Marinobacterium alkalitolerans TaxID=1542925 RepID=A0ABS3Z7J2_9GAMM|nr:DUF3037 domain-containing protein [Marinobacterium alkalitolerans]MBP0047677.1 DUF3037 domain-containing protein [Marinobacterium alkalitolerans]
MATWYKYAVLRACPDRVRGEIVNVGIVVISPEGQLDVLIPDQMNKAAALDSSMKAELIEEIANEACRAADYVSSVQDKIMMLETASNDFIRCSNFAEFQLSDTKHYTRKVNELLNLLVKPVKHKREAQSRRIGTKMKELFKSKSLLGGQDDIGKHLVVPEYPIDLARGFKADFALKNGVMHITQTIDMNTSDPKQKHAKAALHALTLDKATDVFGDDTKRYVVYSAARRNKTVDQTLQLLGDHADEMFNLESSQETKDYIEIIESAIQAAENQAPAS